MLRIQYQLKPRHLYLGVSLRYIMFREGKILNSKTIFVIMNMPPLKIPKDIQVFNGMNQFYYFILDFV
jgi:hypothetical protein